MLFYVFNGVEGEHQIAAYDFDTQQRHNLLTGSSPQFATSGHLVYWREGSLWAVPFDPNSLEVDGEPLPVQNGVVGNQRGWSPYALAVKVASKPVPLLSNWYEK